MKTLPELKLTVENATEEIYKLLKVVKPSWTRDQIELKKLSGGFSCLMYMCFNKEDSTDGVTVRARTNTFQDFPHVRESAFEAKVLHTMFVRGLFPEVLATFQNGYCYSYIPGTPLYTFLNVNCTLDDSRLRLMAHKLAEIHSTQVEGCDYSKTPYFRNMYTILDEKYPVGEKLKPGCPSREVVRKELQMVEELALQLDSPIVLCHGDPHPGNIVYDKDKGIVTYVDWELTHVGYQAADVAYALEIFKLIEMNPAVTVGLPENFQRKYLRFYLEKWFELQGKNESDVTEEDVDKLQKQIDIFRLGVFIFWVTILSAQFAVGMPDHVEEEHLKAIADASLKAQTEQENADTEDKSPPEAKPLSHDEHATQMISGNIHGLLDYER